VHPHGFHHIVVFVQVFTYSINPLIIASILGIKVHMKR